MKIKQYEALIVYIKSHYPNLVDKFEIWHDFDEMKIDTELWAIYWGQDWGDKEIYCIELRFDSLFSEKIWKIVEKKTCLTDFKKVPLSYLEELEGIVNAIATCDDGGDIKYIIDDAQELLQKMASRKKKLTL